jgi:hypothetical protein
MLLVIEILQHAACSTNAKTLATQRSGLFSSFVWEQGFDKVCESSRTLKLFEGFDVQFWETGPWAPPSTFKSFQLVAYIYK